jgi:hypothetical protein
VCFWKDVRSSMAHCEGGELGFRLVCEASQAHAAAVGHEMDAKSRGVMPHRPDSLCSAQELRPMIPPMLRISSPFGVQRPRRGPVRPHNPSRCPSRSPSQPTLTAFRGPRCTAGDFNPHSNPQAKNTKSTKRLAIVAPQYVDVQCMHMVAAPSINIC